MESSGSSTLMTKGVNWKIQPKEGEPIDEERGTNMKAAASINVPVTLRKFESRAFAP